MGIINKEHGILNEEVTSVFNIPCSHFNISYRMITLAPPEPALFSPTLLRL